MGLADDIRAAVTAVAGADWDVRKGTVVPSTESFADKRIADLEAETLDLRAAR